jgi:hypothetical protein
MITAVISCVLNTILFLKVSRAHKFGWHLLPVLFTVPSVIEFETFDCREVLCIGKLGH